MLFIPCTIHTHRDRFQDFWIISVPADAVKNASELLAKLLSGQRRKVVFLDHKTGFTLTTDTAAYNGRIISIAGGDFLKCLKKLFSHDIHHGINHIDWEFSDKHGDIDITVQIEHP